jgi:nitroimidazol reductase NimA-like FMN-containing flavoprotein (pyridoxamine 5'-phosphate oxidase superfamily)
MTTMDEAERFLQGELTEMLRPEALRRLEASRVGRVAYNAPDGPVVVPVNGMVHGTDVFLRTRADSRLGQALKDGPASYQVDAFDPYLQAGWSVLLQGHAQWVGEDELPAYVSERPFPWAAGDRGVHVRIRAARVSGRTLLP